MGVGNYSEPDIREAARAFTGWIDDDLAFKVDPAKHDDGAQDLPRPHRQFRRRRYPATSSWSRRSPPNTSPASSTAISSARTFRRRCRRGSAPCCATTTTRSRRCCARSSCRGTSTAAPSFGDPHQGPGRARRLDLPQARREAARRAFPISIVVSRELGQILLNPPTVAGWAQGRAWITPGLLLARGNFARDVLFPDIMNFTDPNFNPGAEIRRVNDRILAGMDIREATIERGPEGRRHGGRRHDDGERHRQRRGFQHPLRQPGRLPGGGPQDQADPAGGGAVRPLARRGVRRARRPRPTRSITSRCGCCGCRSTPRCARP